MSRDVETWVFLFYELIFYLILCCIRTVLFLLLVLNEIFRISDPCESRYWNLSILLLGANHLSNLMLYPNCVISLACNIWNPCFRETIVFNHLPCHYFLCVCVWVMTAHFVMSSYVLSVIITYLGDDDAWSYNAIYLMDNALAWCVLQ